MIPTSEETPLTPVDKGRLMGSAALGIAWIALPPIAGFYILYALADIATFLRTDLTWGFWGYVAVFAVTAGFGLLPTYSQAFLGGWVFGLKAGLLGSIMGFTGGAAIGYLIARTVTGDSVDRWLSADPKRRAIRDTLARGSFGRSFVIVTLLRLPPSSPFAMTNYALAATRVSFGLTMLATPLGMLPRTAIVCFLAAAAADSGATNLREVYDNLPMWSMITGIVLSVLVIAIIGHIAKQALDALTAQDV